MKRFKGNVHVDLDMVLFHDQRMALNEALDLDDVRDDLLVGLLNFLDDIQDQIDEKTED